MNRRFPLGLALLVTFFCGIAALAEEKPILEWTFETAPEGEGITSVPGIIGTAVDVTGKPQISVPADRLPEGLTAFTVRAWIKPRSVDENIHEILRKEDGEERLWLSITGKGKSICLGLNANGLYRETRGTVDPAVLTDGQWHLVTGTYDGQSTKLYFDLEFIGGTELPGPWKYGKKNAPIFVASLWGSAEFYDGALDEIQLWDRAMSERQVREYFLQIAPERGMAWLKKQIADAREKALEFLPETPEQWAKCTPEETQKWKALQALNASDTAAELDLDRKTADELFDLLARLESNFEPRPRGAEQVSPYVRPVTPEVKDLTPEEAQKKLEEEWLFQCSGNVTPEVIRNEIRYAKALAARIQGVDFQDQLRELDALAEADATTRTYFRVRQIKRGIMFANPAIDFDSVVYVDVPYPAGSEWRHENHHRVGTQAVPGGRLMVLKGLSPAGKQTMLAPQKPLPGHGSFWRPDVSFDGKRVLFCFKPYNEKAFHLYEINADGTGVRQLTDGAFDDLDPIYLPDGENIAFLTGRAHTYVRCVVSANSFVLARMKLHEEPGDGVFILSRNMECEYTPSLLKDGRIIYTRWEYTDKPLWRCQSLWTMNPDGTQVQTFWGNQSVWPDLLKEARPIPGSERVMFAGCGHHDWFAGSIGIIDPAKGLNYPDGLTKVTPDVPWPEVGDGPSEKNESEAYHTAGDYSGYTSPYPISDRDFLVCAVRNGKTVLLLMDLEGNRELIYEGAHHIFHAQPLRPRTVPQARLDLVKWPTFENRDKPEPGIIYSNSVYDNASPELRGKAKFLRIWNLEPKTYTMWDHRPYASEGPATSLVQTDGVKRILGTVPIEDDGSVCFEAPSGVALHFQLLDENHRALHTMRSFTGVMPGEVRGCIGCHESQIVTPGMAPVGKAMKRAPSKITPVPWKDISVSYDRYVEPTLKKYCAKCHENPESKAFQTFNMTRRPGYNIFDEPYVTLVGKPTWGKPYEAPENPAPGFGWADTIMVEAFGILDPLAYQTPKPMTKLSYRSRLIERMASGTHHGVKVTGDDLLRVILWVDAMCPYYGSEELRAMGDPAFYGRDWLPVCPKIQSAPLIPRPGPLNTLHPEKDPAYDAPTMDQVNQLPF
ncbi:MAG: hypothetical protein IJQ31_00280 [Thermoguttaceae bacterium]|nr:hypothetical protein [Thermoguttaceae bacterium]